MDLKKDLPKFRTKAEPEDGGVTVSVWFPREFAQLVPGLSTAAVIGLSLSDKKEFKDLLELMTNLRVVALFKQFNAALNGQHTDADGNALPVEQA